MLSYLNPFSVRNLKPRNSIFLDVNYLISRLYMHVLLLLDMYYATTRYASLFLGKLARKLHAKGPNTPPI